MHEWFRRSARAAGCVATHQAAWGSTPAPGALAAAAGVAAAVLAFDRQLQSRRGNHEERQCCPTSRRAAWTGVACDQLKEARSASILRKLAEAPHEPGKLVLSADCGGTTTRLMLYRVDPKDPINDKEQAPGVLLHEEKYPNIAFKSLKDIMRVFLQQDCGVKDAQPMVAVLALAGIVMNNQCRFTNLDWLVNGHELEVDLKISRVELINDFVAQGYGMLTLNDSEVLKLNDAVPVHGGTIACIGAGTGLGQCFLVYDHTHNEYRCYPSEGAHGEFAPLGAGSDDLQLELLKYLKIKFSGWNRISVERVVSGTGICNIYEFLAHQTPSAVDPKVHKQHLEKPKDAGIIASNATPGSLCEKTLKVFASCYGAQCGTMALWVQPFGGLYITGGVTKRLAEWLMQEGSFMAAYLDKGRLTPLLEKVPIFVVKGDDMGQRGAHRRAVQILKEEIDLQAHHVFEKLDAKKEGFLRIEQLQSAIRNLNDRVLAARLLAEMDVNKDGRIDFDEFRQGFLKLPAAILNQSPDTHPEEERDEIMRHDELVAPPERGLDPESQAKLAEVLRTYQARARRSSVDTNEASRHHAVFKTILWKLRAHGSNTKEDDWLEREFWVSWAGNVLFFSKTEQRVLLYCTQEDLKDAIIEKVDDPSSVFPHMFRVQPKLQDGTPFAATVFAAPSNQARHLWMEFLESLRRGEPVLSNAKVK